MKYAPEASNVIKCRARGVCTARKINSCCGSTTFIGSPSNKAAIGIAKRGGAKPSSNDYLNRGHSDNSSVDALAASVDDNLPCTGTGQANCADNTSADFSQKRTHTLNNGEQIWDLSGNVQEWVDLLDTTQQGTVSPTLDSICNLTGWNGAAGTRAKWGPSAFFTPDTIRCGNGSQLNARITSAPISCRTSSCLNFPGNCLPLRIAN